MLENFPSYINNRASEMPQDILQGMKKIQYMKPKGRPPYININQVRFDERYTSRQSCSLLIENLPPSFSLLKKLSQGGIAPMKALKLLLEKGSIDVVVLIIDEMYLQISCEYSGGMFVGRDENGELGTWWTITNSSNRYTPNSLGNAIIVGDNKVEFLRCFASWLSSWKESSISCCEKFTLTLQTSAALTCTLNASASLTEDLLNEGYEFVIPSRLQSDPLE